MMDRKRKPNPPGPKKAPPPTTSPASMNLSATSVAGVVVSCEEIVRLKISIMGMMDICGKTC